MRHPMKYINGPMGFFAPCDTYVRWSDYAALAAENERLRKFNEEALAHIAKEERKSRERLEIEQADNERLRKAGDAMLGTYVHACGKGLVDEDTAHRVVSDWAKAKEQ